MADDRRRRHRHHHNRSRSNGAVAVSGEPRRHRTRVRIKWRTESEISCCVKYTVFGFNVLFWLIGLAMLLTGVWAQLEKNPFSELGKSLDNKFYLDPAWLLVIVGGVIFIIGFSGCIGALRENTCFLAFFSALLGVILLTELAIAVLGFVAKDWMQKELEVKLDDMIVMYRDDPDLQSLIDWIQKDWLHCCGIHDGDDWDKNIYFNVSAVQFDSPEAGGVPFSCCRPNSNQENELLNYQCGFSVRKEHYEGPNSYYLTGCLESFVVWLNRNITIVGVILMVIAIIQILGICFAQNLRNDIFAQRARWLYEEH